MRGSRTIIGCSFICLWITCTASGLSLHAVPSKSEVYAGAPLPVTIIVNVDEGDAANPKSMFFTDDDIAMSVLDSNGVNVCRPIVEEPRYIGCADRIPVPVGPESTAQRTVMLGKWCTTELAPGIYEVVVRVIRVGIVETGESISKTIQPEMPLEESFRLRIMAPDSGAITEELEHLMQVATQDRRKVTSEAARAERSIAISSIVYCSAPEAFSYQLRLLRGEVPYAQGYFTHCDLYALSKRFAEIHDEKTARELVQLFHDLTNGRTKVKPYDVAHLEGAVLWTIWQMHAGSNPAIVSITDEIVEAFPEPRAPWFREPWEVD